MPTISEQDVMGILERGNGASVVVPSSGGGFVKLSYLWGKLRVDRCDVDGKITPPDRGVGGSDIEPPTVP